MKYQMYTRSMRGVYADDPDDDIQDVRMMLYGLAESTFRDPDDDARKNWSPGDDEEDEMNR